MHTIIIVRHGRTFSDGEVPRRIGLSTDIPLTDAGCTQAEVLGRHFAMRGLVFDQVLSGPLLRTRESARLILASMALQSPTSIVDWLAEIDHGPDENQTEERVLARVGEHAIDAWNSSGEPPPGWKVDAPWRLAQWRELFAERARNPGATLLVTSNGVARFAILALSAASEQNLALATGAYGEIEISPRVAAKLIRWNVQPSGG